MPEPFDVCWERIARADLHRGAIVKTWNDFIDEEPYATRANVGNDGVGRIYIERVKPIPPVISLELGEYLYQMRAALDACVYETACEYTGSRPPVNEEILEFPICATAAKFQGQLNRRKIEIFSDRQRSIIESVQPYNAPPDLRPALVRYNFNRALDILNQWARKDRHRKLHIAATWTSNINPLLRIPPDTARARRPRARPLTPRAPPSRSCSSAARSCCVMNGACRVPHCRVATRHEVASKP